MTDDLKISVIIPVYNVERYLDRCVGSIVSQTYRNLEIILVDDGSPDKSPEMCDAWAQKDSRIKVIHKKNGGLGDARNAGLDVASGDLVGFVDSDDWCEPTMYEKMVDSYQEHRMPIVVCDVWVDWENGWPSEKKCFGEGAASWNRIEAAEAFCGEGLPAWMCNKLFERQLWNGVRFTSQLYEDIPVMRHFLSCVNGISFTRTLEYHYIQHQNSIVNSSMQEKHLTLLSEMLKNFEFSKSVSERGVIEARKAVVWEAYYLLYKMFVQGALVEKQGEMIDIIKEYWDAKNKPKFSNALDLLIAERIASGGRFRYLIRVHNFLQKLYFKLKKKKS